MRDSQKLGVAIRKLAQVLGIAGVVILFGCGIAFLVMGIRDDALWLSAAIPCIIFSPAMYPLFFLPMAGLGQIVINTGHLQPEAMTEARPEKPADTHKAIPTGTLTKVEPEAAEKDPENDDFVKVLKKADGFLSESGARDCLSSHKSDFKNSQYAQEVQRLINAPEKTLSDELRKAIEKYTK